MDSDHDHGDGHSNPHWKADLSLVGRDPRRIGRDPYRIPAKALNIVWGNDHRYWDWIKLNQDDRCRTMGEAEAALLLQVNWIEVTGKIEMPVPKAAQKYSIYYWIKFRPDAFGWNKAPIKFVVKVKSGKQQTVRETPVKMESYQDNKWHEILGGEFTLSRDDLLTETTTTIPHAVVEFGMFEVESVWWKGSMVLAGVIIKEY